LNHFTVASTSGAEDAKDGNGIGGGGALP